MELISFAADLAVAGDAAAEDAPQRRGRGIVERSRVSETILKLRGGLSRARIAVLAAELCWESAREGGAAATGCCAGVAARASQAQARLSFRRLGRRAEGPIKGRRGAVGSGRVLRNLLGVALRC